jgi:photosystem II stability/assembly factor-like uncharacterized protein
LRQIVAASLAAALSVTALGICRPAAAQFYAVQTVGFGDDLTCIAISHRDPNFVLVGTSEGRILRTLDGGATWQSVVVTPLRSTFYGRERQPDPALEYAMGLPGKSPHLQSWIRRQGLTTSGINLAQLLTLKGEKNVAINWIEVAWHNENIIYAGTLNGLYRSGDKGRSFVRIFQGYSSAAERSVLTVATDPHDPRHVMLGTASGLFVSKDGGFTFRKTFNYYLVDGHIREIWFDAEQKGLIHLAMAGSAMASPDSGEHWITTHWNDWGPRADVLSLSLGPSNVRVIGTRDGVFASWQGGEMGTWKRAGLRFVGAMIPKVVATQNPQMWLAVTDQALWLTNDSGLNWRKVHQTGGKEITRWVTAYRGDPSHLWFITNRYIYRAGPPPSMRRYDLRRRAPVSLLKVPPLADFVSRVLKHKGIHFAENQRYRERALFAAFLPSLTAGYHYAPAQDTTMVKNWVRFPNFPYTYYNRSYDGSGFLRNGNFEIIANWDLSRLIFDRARLPHWGRVERAHAALRQELTERLHRLYLEYRRISRVLVFAPPADEIVRQYHEIRLQELAAYLDAMSGGYWSKATGGTP